MISDGVRALTNGGFLLAAAPTGIGKTAAALASALHSSFDNHISPDRANIIFMTGRQTQHKIVVDTVRKINSRIPDGVPKISLVDIIGREGMCDHVDKMTGKCDCEDGVVEESRKSRRADLRKKLLDEPQHVDWTVKYGRARKICPWASARLAAGHADILVCDYNHVFVENVRESSLPAMGIELENSILIVDEAHNLPDRIRSGLERRITDQVFRRALDNIAEYKGNLQRRDDSLDIGESNELLRARDLEKQIIALQEPMAKWFERLKSENNSTKGDDLRISSNELLDVISKSTQGVLDENESTEITRVSDLIDRLFSVVIDEEEDTEDEEQNDCTRIAEILEICIRYRNSPALALVFDHSLEQPRLTSHLLDPSLVGEEIFGTCRGAILMSGTLFPPEMYSEVLGVPSKKSSCRIYSSDFPIANRPVLIANDVTSKFTERETSMSLIGEHVRAVIENTKGNVAIFAPSYSMLERVHSDFENLGWSGKRIIKEEQRMSKRRVEGMISTLYEQKDMGGVAIFGVLNGKLSEGVDYSDNILDALVCIGLPMAPPSAKQDALMEYFTDKFDRSRAWKYVSLQPAVNSVLQALGRPIRKKEDRAIIVLLEKRMLERRVSDCMPKMMKIQTSKPSRTAERVRSFFEI
ncbi:MAG: ATP-dependent DNA helicase [Candidatus Thermoplasmatota archaeon]|nr:ATP-dependent DNA helicase [Candidatus Thermoplasmatota archaeon]